MDRKIFFILLLLAGLALSCRISPPAETTQEIGGQQDATIPAPTGTTPPTATAVPSTATEVLPTKAPTLAPTPTTIPSPTFTVQPTPADLFRDNFDGELAAGWSWIREIPELWSLKLVPGFLRILIQPKNCTARQSNILVREPPAADFVIETFVDFEPLNDFQFAGLTVYMDDNNHIQLGRAQCGQPACVGNGIYFDRFETGAFQEPNFGTNLPEPAKAFLRLQKIGKTFTAYASADNLKWEIIGAHESKILPKYVGLIAGQSCSGSVPADFSYFSIKAAP
jgi:beta-xylosidase